LLGFVVFFFASVSFFLYLQEEGDLSVCNPKAREICLKIFLAEILEKECKI